LKIESENKELNYVSIRDMFYKDVLTEKTLIYKVQIKNRNNNKRANIDWWYGINEVYEVRNLNSFEELKNIIGGWEKIMQNYKSSEFYIVIAGIHQDCVILKKDCIKIKSFVDVDLI